jgi:predicted RNA-binding protein YlxR (DUF448 family)
MCVGCGVRAELPKGRGFELVRFALLPLAEGGSSPVIDLAGSSFGRGVWVHPRSSCLAEAANRGMARAAKTEVCASVDELVAQLANAASERVLQLIGVGLRARKAVIGEQDRPGLAVVALDAARLAERGTIEALRSGAALSFGTKLSLGRASGRELVATVTITDESLASAVRDAIVLSQTAATMRGI